MRTSDWSSDVCSSDLAADAFARRLAFAGLGEFDHVADEFGFQPVVLVEFGFGFARRLLAIGVIDDVDIFGGQGLFALIHRGPPCPVAALVAGGPCLPLVPTPSSGNGGGARRAVNK